MKKFIFPIIAMAFFAQAGRAQASFQQESGGKLRAKMVEYIEQKLSLSREETARFEPIFQDYLQDLKNTNQEYKGDRLVLQDKVVELRLHYRDLFKPVLGEQKSNQVFIHEREFVKQVQEIHNERLKFH